MPSVHSLTPKSLSLAQTSLSSPRPLCPTTPPLGCLPEVPKLIRSGLNSLSHFTPIPAPPAASPLGWRHLYPFRVTLPKCKSDHMVPPLKKPQWLSFPLRVTAHVAAVVSQHLHSLALISPPSSSTLTHSCVATLTVSWTHKAHSHLEDLPWPHSTFLCKVHLSFSNTL